MALEGVWGRAITAVLASAWLALAGCGAEEADAPALSHPIAGVVDRLQKSFRDRDIAAICRSMTREAQDEAGEVAHSSPTICVKDVRKVFGMIDTGGGWLDDERPNVVAVKVDGTSAVATLAAGDWKAAVPFERAGRDWKVASFVGVGTRRLEEVEEALLEDSFPNVDKDKAVRVGTYGGYTCAPLSTDGRSRDLGGCVVRVSDGGPVPIEMLTPYGAFKFGDCYVDYRISIDEEGRTWTDEWEVEGSSDSGCSDINPCIEELRGGGVRLPPWKGRIVATAGGDLLHRTKACIRTCVGMFTGELVVRLIREGRTWRVDPTYHGATGFRLNAPLDLYGKPIRISEGR